jgi:hypothetical protein
MLTVGALLARMFFSNKHALATCRPVADNFLAAMRAHDYNQAFSYCSTERSIGLSPNNLRNFEDDVEEEKRGRLVSYQATNIETREWPVLFNNKLHRFVKAQYFCLVTYRFQFGEAANGTVSFRLESGTWKIIQINIP